MSFRHLILVAALGFAAPATAATTPPGLEAALSYPFQDHLISAKSGETVAWVEDVRGVRNIWIARGPSFAPRQVTHNTADDGQELSGLAFSPDGARLVWVRGGDHDGNWEAAGGLQPDPAADPAEPKVTIWTALVAGGEPVKVTEGDEPTLSFDGRLAFIKDHQAWTATLDGKGAPERLFFDRGHVGAGLRRPPGSTPSCSSTTSPPSTRPTNRSRIESAVADASPSYPRLDQLTRI